jgi:cytoskeletal protein CcmA (bactofilin family)
MALFHRKRRFLDVPEVDLRSPDTTILARELLFEGTLSTPGDAVVAGRLDGDLKVGGRLVLLVGGHIQGAATAGTAKIEGTVEGPLTVTGKLEVGGTARLMGDIRAERVAIAEGSMIRGRLDASEAPIRFTEQRKQE